MGILRSNVKLEVPLSQIHYDDDEFRFKWKKAWLPVPYGEEIMRKEARVLEEFRDNLEDNITITFRWHRLRHLPEDMTIWADEDAIDEIRNMTSRANAVIADMESRIASGTLTMKDARGIMTRNDLRASDAIIRRVSADIVRRIPERKAKVGLKVPLSQLIYGPDSFRFEWNEVWLAVPYERPPLKVRNARLLEIFKELLKSELAVTVCRDCMMQKIEDIDVKVSSANADELDDISGRLEKCTAAIQALVKTGELSLEKAKAVLAAEGLECSDGEVHQILAELIRRMPGQQVKVELMVPLSQLIYGSDSFRFKWNEIWLAVPYEQPPLEVKDTRLLEIFKGFLKSEVKINIFCNHVSRKIDTIDVEVSPDNVSELDGIADRLGRCAEAIQALVKEGKLSLEKAKEVLSAEGLKCSDAEVHQILADIINEMGTQKEPVTISVPLKDIEYGPSQFTFQHDGKSFQLANDKLPFETGPILDEVKDRFVGDITFHLDKDCLVKWDPGKARLLVGDLRMGVGGVGEEVEIYPETLGSFKELRANMICEKINALDKNTIFIGQVEPILQAWGLGLEDREIGDRINATIPPWSAERIFRVPAKDVQYSSYYIRVSLDGRRVDIQRGSLPFGTSDVLDKVKSIFKGSIKVTENRRVGFIWSETNRRLELGEVSASYKVEAEDELLERFRRVHVMYRALKTRFPARPESDIIKIIEHSDYVHGLPPGSFDPRYNPKCIEILEKKAESIYMTGIDLWFKIGNLLVWERPEYRAATYVFKWPEQEKSLEDFIAKIWSYELLEDITRDPSTGYKFRVIHDYDYDLYGWKDTIGSL